MIPISFYWDTLKKSISLRWNGFISAEMQKGEMMVKILGVPISFHFKQTKSHFPFRWVYLKGLFSLFTKWKLKKVEGTFSSPNPMVNGVLYGWGSAIGTGEVYRKIHITINFKGENWCRGEFILSPKILFQHFKRWILPLLREMKGRRP
jgi:hypothetical protein